MGETKLDQMKPAGGGLITFYIGVEYIRLTTENEPEEGIVLTPDEAQGLQRSLGAAIARLRSDMARPLNAETLPRPNKP